MRLVAVEDAIQRLRLDDSVSVADLYMAIDGASAMVLRHLDEAANVFLLDEDGEAVPEDEVVVPADVQTATLTMVGVILRDPDGADHKTWDGLGLPKAVACQLMSRRVPPLA